MRQIVEGVSALHAAGKLHRDIKPTNVIIHTGGEAKVLDFGLAVDEFALKEARQFDVVGTSAYMAPEQATGRPLSPASDWFAVGVMLYQALCGESPFHGSFRETTDAKLNRAFRLPSEIAEDVDPALRRAHACSAGSRPRRPARSQADSLHALHGDPGRALSAP